MGILIPIGIVLLLGVLFVLDRRDVRRGTTWNMPINSSVGESRADFGGPGTEGAIHGPMLAAADSGSDGGGDGGGGSGG